MISQRQTRVSVAVIVRGEAEELQRTLDALGDQTGPDFEVIVVAVEVSAPVRELIAQRKDAGELKTMTCDSFNLSAACNRGIAAAAGDIVAFLAEGAAPRSDWLPERIAGLEERDIAGVGGVGDDEDEGWMSECLYTRFGDPAPADEAASLDHAYPFSTCFPWLSCGDGAFRRDALVQAGGFDENFRGRLGEADLCCRLTDGGWRLHRLSGGGIRRSAASRRLEEMRALRSPIADLSDRIRFPLVNGRDHHDLNAIFISTSARFAEWRDRIARRVERHELEEGLLFTFDNACDAAWSALLPGGGQTLSRRLPGMALNDPPPFTPFPRHDRDRRLPLPASAL